MGIEVGNSYVKYIPEEDLDKEPITDFSFLPLKEIFPIHKELRLNFEDSNEVINYTEIELDDEITGDKRGEIIHNEELFKEYGLDIDNNLGHKIGGHPHYAQVDVCPEKHMMLLQIDSSDDISWGDYGTAHFFIKEEDLKNKSFENIEFSWECY